MTRGFSVTATGRGELVEVAIDPFIVRPGNTRATDRQVQAMSTSVVVEPGRWVAVGGGSEFPEGGGRTSSTAAQLEESHVLIRVAREGP